MYALFKLLHLAAVVVFLGNIITGLFWHAHAARSRDPKLLANAMEGIIRSDRLFTVPGVIAIVATGIVAAMYGQLRILRTGWILWTIVLFSVSGFVFALRVAPLQRQLLALAQTGATSLAFDFQRYRALALRWELWGGIALAAPVAGFALMVLKPAL
jgi:uncharacterized membrane protein